MGHSEPLAYQWLFEGAELQNWGHVLGADTASLVIKGVEDEDMGRYTCRVSNGAGTVISDAAVLTIEKPPPAGAGAWRKYR